MSPRWRKLLGDLQAAQGRIVMMVLAIAAGLFGVGVILGAFSILTREMQANYQSTNPASALLELDRVDNNLVEAVRQRPDIASAEAGSTVLAKIKLDSGDWMPLLLFVIPDFKTLEVNSFKAESGAWPPPTGSILLERQALTLIKAKVGDSLSMQTPNGSSQKIRISGTVHDPGLAPAGQEQTAWAYATPATLEQLGEGHELHILKVIVRNQTRGVQAIESTVGGLTVWLKQQGRTVKEIRIPPPGMHPHQTQMTTILTMLLLFSLLALVLSAVLVANTIAALLGQQIRQIGVMKTIGARTMQITGMYLALIATIGLTATLIALPPSLTAARSLSSVIAELLNFTITSDAVPAWVFLVQIASGILVPVLIALVPILSATRITVRQALDDVGVNRSSFGTGSFDALLGQIRGLDGTLLLALRNTFRRRGRLLLTLGLLASAGAMFLTSLNVMAGWERTLEQAAQDRRYDAEVRFNRFESLARVNAVLKKVPGVQAIEPWNRTPAAVTRTDQLEILRTYPDGGHGSFMLRSTPANSQLIQLTLMSGRWLQPNDTNAVVLNHSAKAFFPTLEVGDQVKLSLGGKLASFTLVGVARELISPASAYVTPETFNRAMRNSEHTNAVRIVLENHDLASVAIISNLAEQTLEQAGIGISITVSETKLDSALNGHVYILIFALIAMAVLMAVVGGLGLMSAMSTSVIERTREFGIMRTIGARGGTILRNVIGEGVLIGLLSWLIALPLSLPLSFGIGNLVGSLAFRFPLELTVSPLALLIWFGVIVIGSVAASAYPAWTASRLTIRETLAYL
jgi:putative ABC transport system permease protein